MHCRSHNVDWKHCRNIAFSYSPFHIVNVIHSGRTRVIDLDAQDLPVQLALIDHGVCAQRLDGVHAAAVQLAAPNLHHIHWVIISLQPQFSVLQASTPLLQ